MTLSIKQRDAMRELATEWLGEPLMPVEVIAQRVRRICAPVGRGRGIRIKGRADAKGYEGSKS